MNRLSEKWMVVVSVLFGTFTVILNNSMLNPALPHFMEIFSVDAISVSWIITIFMVAMGMTMPITGYLGDKLGKKETYMMGLCLFVLGSILGTFAWNLESIIIFRALQGIGGGMMMPTAMALIFAAFPREERGMAVGMYGVAAMVAPAIGPTIGGLIVEHASWSYLFLLNVPFGVLGLVTSFIFLKAPKGKANLKFDLWGFITVTVGVGSILYALGRISELAQLSNPVNIGLILLGIGSLIIFVRHENRIDQPLLNLSVFKVSTYSLSVWVNATASIGLFAGLFLIPILIQYVYGLSPVITGLVLFPSAIFSGIFMSLGGRILDKKGARGVVTVGIMVLGISTLLLGFNTMNASLWFIVILMLVRGIGLGLSNMPATTAGMNSIPDQLVAQGSAMNNVLRQISSAFGIVFISIFYEVRRAQMFSLGETMKQSSLEAINEAFILVGILTILTIPAGYLIGDSKKDRSSKTKVQSSAS